MKLIKSNFNEYSIQTLSTAKLKGKKKKIILVKTMKRSISMLPEWLSLNESLVFERREEFELERQR